MSEKKRDTTRVEFHTRAELRVNGKQLEGTVENLSLKGMYLKPETSHFSIQTGQKVEITIHLSGASTKLSIEVQGVVVRWDKAGLGIEFTEMEFDTFVHLRNIVAYNAGDEDRIMEEFSNTYEGL
ncbi:MAG: PilZ domain-containing protein [bacterium]